MAALSLPERASVFEILRAFWEGSTATVTNGYGLMLTISDLETVTNGINSRLDDIESDDTATEKIRDLVEDWDEIASTQVQLNNSTVGSISGITISSDAIKENIRQRLGTYLQVFHMFDAIKRRNAESGGAGNIVAMIR